MLIVNCVAVTFVTHTVLVPFGVTSIVTGVVARSCVTSTDDWLPNGPAHMKWSLRIR